MEKNNIPKIKRIDKKNRQVKIPLLNLLLVFFCTMLLVFSTFIQLKITHLIIPFDMFSNKSLEFSDYITTFVLIPQIPAVMFVVGLLGRKLGITSILIYMILGTMFPIYALGGGLSYVTQFGFGYILAYIPAVFLAGSILKYGFTLKNILKATLIGVFTIHFLGIIYMLFVAIFRHEGLKFIKGWIIYQSALKFAYDYIISLLALLVAKYGNKYVRYLIY